MMDMQRSIQMALESAPPDGFVDQSAAALWLAQFPIPRWPEALTGAAQLSGLQMLADELSKRRGEMPMVDAGEGPGSLMSENRPDNVDFRRVPGAARWEVSIDLVRGTAKAVGNAPLVRLIDAALAERARVLESPGYAQIPDALRVLKRKALIAELRPRWPTIVRDLDEASRNGLVSAKAGQAGMWLFDASLAWAQQRGKLDPATTAIAPNWPLAVARVHRAK